jgi:hypothetical protein
MLHDYVMYASSYTLGALPCVILISKLGRFLRHHFEDYNFDAKYNLLTPLVRTLKGSSSGFRGGS